MNDQLKELGDVLGGHGHHILIVLAAWMGTARLAMKPFSAFIQNGLTKLAVVNPVLANRIVNSATYKTIGFLSDWLLSVKLATADSLIVHQVASTGNTDRFAKATPTV